MRAEGIRVHAAPARVGPARPLPARADAVAPVVLVGEAAAGPADDGSFDTFQRVDEGGADTACVWDFGVFSDPDAVVDTLAEMLGELSENIAVYCWARSRCVNRQLQSIPGG